MNILIYIPLMSRSAGGVFQYTVNLLSLLSESKIEAKFYILNNSQDKLIASIINKDKRFLFVRFSNSKLIDFYIQLIAVLNAVIRKLFKISFQFNIPSYLDLLIKKYKIDFIHCPYQDLPITNLVPGITTMHDVQELHFPEFFSSAQRASRAVNYKRCIDNAKFVIVSYDHVKKDICKYFEKNIHEIKVVSPEINKLWIWKFKKEEPSLQMDNNVPQIFLLYPAATWEHKNHKRLLLAIDTIKKKYNKNINLICTGNITPFYTDMLLPLIKELDLDNTVHFLSVVSDEELYRLYKRAKAVVVPTLYEAGSFPLLESMIMGIPVVCSNVTSLPETIGSDEFIFDPYDVDDIADKIFRIMYDAKYIADNQVHIKNRLDGLFQSDAEEQLTKIYSSLYVSKSK